MKNSKKILIIISIMIVLICFIFILFTNKTKNIILTCYKEQTFSDVIKQTLNYEVIKNDDFVDIKQTTKLILDDFSYNSLLLKGYDPKLILEYYSITVEKELKDKLKDYNDYVEIKTETTTKEFSVSVSYSINKKNDENMLKLLGFDFYNNGIDKIREFYEMGDFICEN